MIASHCIIGVSLALCIGVRLVVPSSESIRGELRRFSQTRFFPIFPRNAILVLLSCISPLNVRQAVEEVFSKIEKLCERATFEILRDLSPHFTSPKHTRTTALQHLKPRRLTPPFRSLALTSSSLFQQNTIPFHLVPVSNRISVESPLTTLKSLLQAIERVQYSPATLLHSI